MRDNATWSDHDPKCPYCGEVARDRFTTVSLWDHRLRERRATKKESEGQMSDEEIQRAKDKCKPLLEALWPGVNANIYVSWRLFERKWGCLVPGPKEPLWEGKGYETIEDALEQAVPELTELLKERIQARQKELDALSDLLVEKEELTTDSEDNPKCPHCGEEIKDYTNGETFMDEEEREFEMCPHCEKEFHVTVYVSFSFVTEKAEAE